MMTKMEYNDRLAELQAQLDELKNAQIEDAPPHPRWVPSNADTYYSIGTCGDVFQDWTDDINSEIDKSRLSSGNVFKTKAEAEFAAAQRKVLAEMREWAGNWDDEYSLRYDEDNGIEAFFQVSYQKSYGEMRFATKKDAENCIEAVGKDRIKKYYFMIPEGDKNV